MAPAYGDGRWAGALLIKGLLCACVMFMLLSVAVARPGAGFTEDQLRADTKLAEEAGFQGTSNEHVLNVEQARQLEENFTEGRELFHTDYAAPTHNCKNDPGGKCR